MSRDNHPIVAQFVQGLRSRSQQNKTAQELLLYVKTELREMPQEELLAFLDEFNHSIFDMISSADNSEKKGGVLAISKSSNGKCKQTNNFHLSPFRMPRQRRCCQHNDKHFTLPQHSSRLVSLKRHRSHGAGSEDACQVGAVAGIKRR